MAVRILPTSLKKNYVVEIEGQVYFCIEEWGKGKDPDENNFLLDRRVIQSQIIEGRMREVEIKDKEINEKIVAAIAHRLTIPNIVSFTDVTDNWGGIETSFRTEEIHHVLTSPDEWTDDMYFVDERGKEYFIDDLVGKEVFVEGFNVFMVPQD
jgi:hypothetical protein